MGEVTDCDAEYAEPRLPARTRNTQMGQRVASKLPSLRTKACRNEMMGTADGTLLVQPGRSLNHFSVRPQRSSTSRVVASICGFCSQPTKLRVLPVQVRPRDLAVSPRSHTRHLMEVTSGVKARA